jgi:hypothetical protein
MPTRRLFLVRFRIDGCVEIEAKHMGQREEEYLGQKHAAVRLGVNGEVV